MTYVIVSNDSKNPDPDKPKSLERESRSLTRFTLWILGTVFIIWGISNLLCNDDDDLDNGEYFCPDTNINLYDEHYYTPEQIHLSLGRNESEYIVTWSTKQPINSEVIYYIKYPDGSVGKQFRVKGNLTIWTSEETNPQIIEATRTRYMDHYTYRAPLNGLIPNSHYIYRITSFDERVYTASRVYDFYTKNLTNPTETISFAFYGDLGLVNGQSIPRLIRDVDRNEYDFIIHNGDFAYDMNTEHGTYGDRFMRTIEPIAARLPYQTSVGNHEIYEYFLHYNERFSMINSANHDVGKSNNFWYSFNAGPIHFIAISTEHWYFMDYLGMKPFFEQWQWLKDDLKMANEPDERAKRPWIVVFGHRPIYCSSSDRDDCTKESCLLRRGLPFFGGLSLEKLLYENGVDIELYSHEHQYERFLPIYNGQVLNGTDIKDNPYHNPRGPVHLISGSAGCQERIDPFMNDKIAPGSVKRVADYGYTRIKVVSPCKIEFEQISDDFNGTRVDHFVISKTRQNFPKQGLNYSPIKLCNP